MKSVNLEMLPAWARADLKALAVTRKFKDRAEIFAVGDKPDGAYFVIEGAVCHSSLLPSALSSHLLMLQEGDWFGELSLLDDGVRTHFALAHGDVTLGFVRRAAFNNYLEKHPELYPAFIKLLCSHMRLLFVALEDQRLLGLRERTIKQLLLFTDGQKDKADVEIELRLPQDELANFLGVSRASLNRTLRQLASEGLIDIGYRKIVIRNRYKLFAELAALDAQKGLDVP